MFDSFHHADGSADFMEGVIGAVLLDLGCERSWHGFGFIVRLSRVALDIVVGQV